MMGREPPIIAVAPGKPVQQIQQHSLLPGTAGTAEDQAIGERCRAEHQRVARYHASRCTRTAARAASGLAGRKQVEKCDVARFPRADTVRQQATSLAAIASRALAQRRRGPGDRIRPRNMSSKGEAGIGRDRSIQPLRSRRGHIVSFNPQPRRRHPAPRTRRWTRMAKVVSIRQHAAASIAPFAADHTIRHGARRIGGTPAHRCPGDPACMVRMRLSRSLSFHWGRKTP